MLIPNNKQKTKLFQCFGVGRFAYNWALGKQQENYKNGGKFISDNDLRKEFSSILNIENTITTRERILNMIQTIKEM